MTSAILSLPEELRYNIAHFLEGEDLRLLRLTCKQFHAAATEALFSFVRLYPSEESIDRYNKILEHAQVSRLVRHVELNTLKKDEVEHQMWGRAELTEECLTAFKAFRNFTNLTGVTLRFSENASSNSHHEWTEWPQTVEFRQPILQDFFKTLAHPSASKIKNICLDNIQNINDKSFMQSETALSVLSRITALWLYIATEYHDASPECNLEMEELHDFMTQLRPLWLEPASSNLTTLVLYQSFYFGFSPKLDLRGLHIPNLRTLALGNYVFTHDWQLDWLSSHSSSLQNLYLDDCLVVFYALFYNTEVDSEGYPVIDTNGSNDASRMDQYMFFDQTWSRILGHFRAHLSSLRHFRMGKSTRWQRYNTPFHPSEYEDLEIGIFRDRYQMFNMGIGPCQYTDEFTSRSSRTPLEDVFTEEDGRGTADGDKAFAFLERFDEQAREDTNALVELLNAIGQPLPEDNIDRVGDLMLPGY